jgi:hypothetical protein
MVILNIKKTLKLSRFNKTISLKHLSNYLSFLKFEGRFKFLWANLIKFEGKFNITPRYK